MDVFDISVDEKCVEMCVEMCVRLFKMCGNVLELSCQTVPYSSSYIESITPMYTDD